MATPEERLRQRERVAITTASAGGLPAADIAWSGVWAGLLVATAVMVVLMALGVAVGVSVLDVNPATAGNGQGWTIGAGLWSFVTLLIAMFAGGFVSTRAGGDLVRPLPAVHGTCVWVLALGALTLFGFLRLASLGPAGAAPAAVAQPAATIAGWVGFFVLVVSLATAIGGAAAGAPRRIA